MMRQSVVPCLRRAFLRSVLASASHKSQGVFGVSSINGVIHHNSTLYPKQRMEIMISTNLVRAFSGNIVGDSHAEEITNLKKRLLIRSRQRGFLELDLLIGKWTEDNLNQLDDTHVKALVELLDLETPHLWKYLTGQEVPPTEVSANPIFTAIHNQVLNRLQVHTSDKTRAAPGYPWVRGWDDNRKIGNPPAGNQ